MSDTEQRMQQRYGAPRPARKRALVSGVVVLGLVALGWLLWVVLFHSRPLVHSDIISYTATDEHAATARFTVVRRTEGVKATCLLRATAADHSIVGELNFVVDSSFPATATLEESVRTERQATSVDLLGCSAPGQNQRR